MGKIIYREPINGKVLDIEVDNKMTDLELVFVFENGERIKLSYDHNQDCCEHVYADFEQIKYYKKEIIGKEFKEMVIQGVDEIGFIICLYQDWEKAVKVFVPCYNEQNGYYGSNLDLIITSNGIKKTIDISGLVEDNTA